MAKSKNGNLDLVGTWEAAEILGVERPRIGRWLKKWRAWAKAGRKGQEPDTKIPKPVADLKSGPVWHRRDIEKFARQRAAAGVAADSDD